MRTVWGLQLPLGHGLSEPLLESDRAESGIARGREGPLAQLGAEVARTGICDDFTRIVPRLEALSNKRVQTELLGSGHFNDSIQRLADRNLRHGTRDIVGGHGLDQHRSQAIGMRRKMIDALAAGDTERYCALVLAQIRSGLSTYLARL